MKPQATILILLAALAGAASAQEARPVADPAVDRGAILAMLGEYDVDFAFDETVLLAPGYERAPAMRSGGSEVVILVEDSARADGTPSRIVLQHILVDPTSGHVTKHWRQDWTWEATQRFEFSADQTWRVRPLDPEQTRGAWTQCVYEVSDAPRYCGTGRGRALGRFPRARAGSAPEDGRRRHGADPPPVHPGGRGVGGQ